MKIRLLLEEEETNKTTTTMWNCKKNATFAAERNQNRKSGRKKRGE